MYQAISTAQQVIATLVNLVSYTYVAAVAAGYVNRVSELLERAEREEEIDYPESKHIVCHSLCVAPPPIKVLHLPSPISTLIPPPGNPRTICLAEEYDR